MDEAKEALMRNLAETVAEVERWPKWKRECVGAYTYNNAHPEDDPLASIISITE